MSKANKKRKIAKEPRPTPQQLAYVRCKNKRNRSNRKAVLQALYNVCGRLYQYILTKLKQQGDNLIILDDDVRLFMSVVEERLELVNENGREYYYLKEIISKDFRTDAPQRQIEGSNSESPSYSPQAQDEKDANVNPADNNHLELPNLHSKDEQRERNTGSNLSGQFVRQGREDYDSRKSISAEKIATAETIPETVRNISKDKLRMGVIKNDKYLYEAQQKIMEEKEDDDFSAIPKEQIKSETSIKRPPQIKKQINVYKQSIPTHSIKKPIKNQKKINNNRKNLYLNKKGQKSPLSYKNNMSYIQKKHKSKLKVQDRPLDQSIQICQDKSPINNSSKPKLGHKTKKTGKKRLTSEEKEADYPKTKYIKTVNQKQPKKDNKNKSHINYKKQSRKKKKNSDVSSRQSGGSSQRGDSLRSQEQYKKQKQSSSKHDQSSNIHTKQVKTRKQKKSICESNLIQQISYRKQKQYSNSIIDEDSDRKSSILSPSQSQNIISDNKKIKRFNLQQDEESGQFMDVQQPEESHPVFGNHVRGQSLNIEEMVDEIQKKKKINEQTRKQYLIKPISEKNEGSVEFFQKYNNNYHQQKEKEILPLFRPTSQQKDSSNIILKDESSTNNNQKYFVESLLAGKVSKKNQTTGLSMDNYNECQDQGQEGQRCKHKRCDNATRKFLWSNPKKKEDSI